MDFLVTTYNQAATGLVTFTEVPRALLHVHLGMMIFLGCQLLMGTRRGSLVAVLATVLLAAFHEGMNRIFHSSWRLADTGEDLVLTLFWPTMYYAASIYRRWRWARQQRLRGLWKEPHAAMPTGAVVYGDIRAQRSSGRVTSILPG